MTNQNREMGNILSRLCIIRGNMNDKTDLEIQRDATFEILCKHMSPEEAANHVIANVRYKMLQKAKEDYEHISHPQESQAKLHALLTAICDYLEELGKCIGNV